MSTEGEHRNAMSEQDRDIRVVLDDIRVLELGSGILGVMVKW